MSGLLLPILHLLTAVARLLGPGGAKALVAENLLIKQQLLILTRSRQRAPNLMPRDRILLGLWSLLLRPARFGKVAVVIRPATLFSFQQALVRRKYKLLFSPKKRGKPGPRGPSQELIRAIVELRRRNPRFGCPRIALIIAKMFALNIDKDVVRHVLATHYRPRPGDGGRSGLTFIGHAKDSLWSVDLFRCQSVMLRTHWVLVVMEPFTRRIIGVGVHADAVDGTALCRMFNHAIARQGAPRYLSSNNDPVFEYQRWQANLRQQQGRSLLYFEHPPARLHSCRQACPAGRCGCHQGPWRGADGTPGRRCGSGIRTRRLDARAEARLVCLLTGWTPGLEQAFAGAVRHGVSAQRGRDSTPACALAERSWCLLRDVPGS